MKTKDIKWCPQHGYPLPCHKCGMPLSAKSQKEIYEAGYNKAMAQLAGMTEECKQMGRREVADRLTKDFEYCDSAGDNFTGIGYFISEGDWESLKKEWEL